MGSVDHHVIKYFSTVSDGTSWTDRNASEYWLSCMKYTDLCWKHRRRSIAIMNNYWRKGRKGRVENFLITS